MGERKAAREGSGARETGVVGGRYALHEAIGIGDTSAVWRATDLRLQAPRAVKVLHPFAAENAARLTRFLDEARTMARIEHANVLRVYDLGAEDGTWYCAMELGRESLGARVRRTGPVKPSQALRWTFEVVLALDAAHRLGVVHRDVRAANVLLAGDDTARLADFGVARLRQRVTGVTITGEVLGERGWAAPEQLEDPSRVGPAADLYGAGMLLLFLVTGRLLPEAGDPPVSSRRLPPVVLDLLRGSLGEDPASRWPNALSMLEAIARASDVVSSAIGEPLRGAAWLERAAAQRAWLGGEG